MNKPKVSIIIPVYNAEDRLGILLDQVKQQTLSDYEVILINDGSSDESQSIIDSYCEEDIRFRSIAQENRGAAMARNKGLEQANGSYIAFFDADDLVPEDALENLYTRAESEDADLVVGARMNAYLTMQKKNKQSFRFVQQSEFHKLDPGFLSSFSVCNKLFRKAVIDEHQIRFQQYRDAEDGIFVFSFLRYCKRIVGCDVSVYSYRKRPFYEQASASQTLHLEELKGSSEALEKVKSVIEEILDEENVSQGDERRTTLQSAFYFRCANITYLNKYYRHLWNLDKKTFKFVCEKFYECRKHMTYEDFEALCQKQIDLNLEGDLKDPKEIRKAPSLVIVYSGKASGERLRYFVQSLYQQIFPDFVVYVSSEAYKNLEPEYRKKKNLLRYSGTGEEFLQKIIQEKKSEFVLFADETVYFDEVSIRRAVSALKRKPDVAMAVEEPYRLDIQQNICKRIKEMKLLFHKKVSEEEYLSTDEKRFDQFHINKIVRTEALADPEIFQAFLKHDWDIMVKHLSPSRVKDGWVFIRSGSKEIKRRAGIPDEETTH